MTAEIPAKRRRGGQPRNQNATGKGGGNRTNRRHRFARGNQLGGAPLGNQNAKKERPAAHIALLKAFEHDPEAAEWIRSHAHELDSAGFKDDNERDRALFDGYRGLTPEVLAAKGLELKMRWYTAPDFADFEDDDLAA